MRDSIYTKHESVSELFTKKSPRVIFDFEKKRSRVFDTTPLFDIQPGG